jgi:hypothetical protein
VPDRWLSALVSLALTSVETMPRGRDALPGGDTAQSGKIRAASALAMLPTLVLLLRRQRRRQAGLARAPLKRSEARRRRGLTGLAEPASFRAPQDDP